MVQLCLPRPTSAMFRKSAPKLRCFYIFLCPKATFTSAFFGYLATVLRAINIINRIQ